MLNNIWRYIAGTLRFFLVDFGIRQLWRVVRTGRGSTLQIRLRGVPHPITIRPTKVDVLVLWQTFGIKQCEVTLPFTPNLIIDAGANIGCTVIAFSELYPEARIIAIEPDKTNAALARKNTAAYPNARIVEGAVWHRATMLEIENPDDESWAFRIVERPLQEGSIHAAFGGTALEATTTQAQSGIRAYTIDELSEGAPIDLLKVDIEGGEQYLFRENTAWLSLVRAMFVELHGKECRATVAEAAHRAGFRAYPPQGEYAVFMR